MLTTPTVSILVPAYNGERWIAEALTSAIGQTFENTEILVSDNGSTDRTVEIARSFDDPRIRIILADGPNIGLVGNHNRLLRMASGAYLKFLHADDVLLPECVETMVEIAETERDVGLVFAARTIISDGDDDPEWISEFGGGHEHFGRLERVNDGRALASQLLSAGFVNWIGEPSAVLLSRPAIERVGMFNSRIRQINDLELWLRVSLYFRVGFVETPLVLYRHHSQSVTAMHRATSEDWLDPLWLAESLLAAAEPHDHELHALRRLRLFQSFKNQALRLRHLQVDAALPRYASYRLRAAMGQRPVIHPSLRETRAVTDAHAQRQRV